MPLDATTAPRRCVSAAAGHRPNVGRVPELVKQLDRLNEVLERLVTQREAGSVEAKGAPRG